MGISIGGQAIADMRVGTTPVQKVYAGPVLVWERETPSEWPSSMVVDELDALSYDGTYPKQSFESWGAPVYSLDKGSYEYRYLQRAQDSLGDYYWILTTIFSSMQLAAPVESACAYYTADPDCLPPTGRTWQKGVMASGQGVIVTAGT